ncbi:MAG: large conductance mechanosensitive channel protein MscL [Gaiella sp.]
MDEFKAFLMRGNVVDLAVAVVIGVAFGAVVTSLVDDILMSIIAMIIGKPDFSSLSFTINDAEFGYGRLLTAIVTFVAVAAAIFFFVVKPMQAVMARMTKPAEDPGPTNEEKMIALLEKIAAK